MQFIHVVMGGFPNPLPTGYPPFIFSWFSVYACIWSRLPLSAPVHATGRARGNAPVNWAMTSIVLPVKHFRGQLFCTWATSFCFAL